MMRFITQIRPVTSKISQRLNGAITNRKLSTNKTGGTALAIALFQWNFSKHVDMIDVIFNISNKYRISAVTGQIFARVNIIDVDVNSVPLRQTLRINI